METDAAINVLPSTREEVFHLNPHAAELIPLALRVVK